eukprot:scaffold3467_cov69-Cyclotella_meneghiniana.AAC.2
MRQYLGLGGRGKQQSTVKILGGGGGGGTCKSAYNPYNPYNKTFSIPTIIAQIFPKYQDLSPLAMLLEFCLVPMRVSQGAGKRSKATKMFTHQ